MSNDLTGYEVFAIRYATRNGSEWITSLAAIRMKERCRWTTFSGRAFKIVRC